MGETDTERLESYVFIGITGILSMYILIGAYIHAKKARFPSDLSSSTSTKVWSSS